MTLLLFPLKWELDFFLKHFGEEGYVRTQFQHTPVYCFADLELLCAFTGQGKVQMALSAQALCQKFPEVQSLIVGGSAGRLAADLQLGDLVLGEITIEHDFRVRTRSMTPPAFPADLKLLEKWKSLGLGNGHIGKIASGDEDIVSRNRRSELHSETLALCVAWEGAGGARASRFLKKPFIEIRVITDLGDSSSSSGESLRGEFEAQLDISMKNFAQAMKAYLKLSKDD
jgi:adenosylhomocysteine nucleosidase